MNLNKRVLLVAAFLLCTIALRAWVSISPQVPLRISLAQFPSQISNWRMVTNIALAADVSGVLKADDYLERRYRDPQGHDVDFFIAYYQTQRAGESMHSPKNCLPGSGWTPVINDTLVLKEDSQGHPIRVNRYVIEKDGERALAVYWYQANGRIIASEYAGKFYLVWEALRTGRRDGALVRILVPLKKNESPEASLEAVLSFARAVEPQLPRFLPN